MLFMVCDVEGCAKTAQITSESIHLAGSTPEGWHRLIVTSKIDRKAMRARAQELGMGPLGGPLGGLSGMKKLSVYLICPEHPMPALKPRPEGEEDLDDMLLE
jgi:hypothetical protein